jgi:hypothetical protein
MPTPFSMTLSDADMQSLQDVTDSFNAIEARRPDAPPPVDALTFLTGQVQTRILDTYTQLRTDAEQDALVQQIIANPAALQAASAVLTAAAPVGVPVQAGQDAKIVP